MDKENEFHQLVNSGNLYDCNDSNLLSYQFGLMAKLREFNETKEDEEGFKKREKLLKELLGTYSEGLFITPPVYANFGLKHLHVGKNVYFNFGVTLVDDANIFIGDNTLIGPNVTIVTASHPISPTLRKHALQYNKPVHIGKNVWIGAGAIILPGVSIGDNTVIGAGSVVTKSFGSNLVLVGNPAHVLREIDEKDYSHYDKKPIPEEILAKYK